MSSVLFCIFIFVKTAVLVQTQELLLLMKLSIFFFFLTVTLTFILNSFENDPRMQIIYLKTACFPLLMEC